MTGTEQPLVQVEIDRGIATLTLDSPHNRNALSERLVGELLAGITQAADDDEVRTVVLTHTGSAFCAGADLSAATATSGPEQDPARHRAEQMVEVMRAIITCPKPVVGRIDGHVRAGGMGLVAACDIVVVGPGATFGLTESRLGLAASVISLTVLPRLTSRAASQLFLTGQTFSAARALDIGLVSMVVDDPAAAVQELCVSLSACSPQGLRESKSLVNRTMTAEIERSSDRVIEQSARLFHSEEAREGMSAFLQKRPPRWAG